MTTIKDLLNDLVIESMQFGSENNTVTNTLLADKKREELTEEYTQKIKERINIVL